MPLRGRLEIALQLNIFRNIDLFQQGLYQLRITLHHVVNDVKIYARPTDVYKATSLTPNSHLCLCPPHIIDELSAFCSRIILIRYSEEEIQLHDVAVFTTDFDLRSDFSTPPLVMEVELLFSDVTAASSASPSDELNPSKTMRNVSTAEYRIFNPCHGHCEFIRLAFDDMHFASVTSTLHCMLLSCCFREMEIQEGDLEVARKGSLRVVKTEREVSEEEIAKMLFGEEMVVGSEETNQVYTRLILGFLNTLSEVNHLIKRLLDSSSSRRLNPLEISLPQASEYSGLIATHIPTEIVQSLLGYIQTVNSHSRAVFDILLLALQDHPWEIAYLLKESYKLRMKEISSDAIFRGVLRWTEAEDWLPGDIGELHKKSARVRRADRYFNSLARQTIADLTTCPEPQSHPILFDEAYIAETVPEDGKPAASRTAAFSGPRRRKRHLVVLVHGFGGTAFDVRMLKNHIYQEYPEVMIHSAHANEEDGTNGDILIMGGKLAMEVLAFISEYFPKNSLQKLSFIGHSMGGLIIRAALPLLSDLKPKLHFYMSLSTPHLGYLKKPSSIVNIGICVLKLLKSSLSLSQLTLRDNKDKRQCALYSLSTFKGLDWFNHVFFLSSAQDAYAPLESARIQLTYATTQRPKTGEILTEMAHNIISSLRPEALRRVDVSFNLDNAGLDGVIGRAAHIQFLENSALMRTLVFGFPELFESN